MDVVGGCERLVDPVFVEKDRDCVEGGCRGGVEADGACCEGSVSGGGGAPESLGDVGRESLGVESLESGGGGGAFCDEAFVFRCLAVEVWRGGVGGVGE